MKKLFTLFLMSMAIFANSQTLKTYNGPYTINGCIGNGTASYTYYEDPDTRKYVKHGSFNATFKGTGEDIGFYQTISGKFENGLRTGIWTITITFTDFNESRPVLGDNYYMQSGGMTYRTGKISLISNYKNGLADGNWKEIRTYKTRQKVIYYGSYQWGSFGPEKTVSINMNFNKGYLVGSVSVNDEFNKCNITGNLDENSFLIGKWVKNDFIANENYEIYFKDNILFETIFRTNSGNIISHNNYQDVYNICLNVIAMPPELRFEEGYSIDTVPYSPIMDDNFSISTLRTYIYYLWNIRLFNCNMIEGDITFNEGAKGGFFIVVNQTNYAPLSEIQSYKEAEIQYNKNDLAKALSLMNQIKLYELKPSDRKIVSDKVAAIRLQIESLINTYGQNIDKFNEQLNLQRDSLNLDLIYFSKQIALPTIIARSDNPKIKGARQNPYNITYINGDSKEIFNCGCENEIIQKPWIANSWIQINPCFINNKGLYNFTQIEITEQYFKYLELINIESKRVSETYTEITLDDKQYKFYQYDLDTFINNLSNGKKQYTLSKTLIALDKSIKQKEDQIKLLDSKTQKKILVIKQQIVFDDFLIQYQNYSNVQTSLKIMKNIDAFLEKVISLYSQDTKVLEKQLKNDGETSDQIESIIFSY